MKYIRLVPLAFLSTYGLKYLFLQANYTDVATIAIFAMIGALFEYMNYKQSLTLSSKDIEIINKKLAELEKSNEDLRTHLSGLQLGNQMRFNGKR